MRAGFSNEQKVDSHKEDFHWVKAVKSRDKIERDEFFKLKSMDSRFSSWVFRVS